MTEPFELSVIISTYNRCDRLSRAIESLLSQQAEGVSYELVVVDNNSTDRTREVVESFVNSGHANLSYVFERQQGVSYGRNAGIRHAGAPLLAFTDDDMLMAPGWVAAIKRTFDAHPEVWVLGGKVLPKFPREPPKWLTEAHLLPLGIIDHGDRPLRSNKRHRMEFPTCNLAFRRVVFERFGLFDTEWQRVDEGVCSLEDYEFNVRMWRAGIEGMYVPEMLGFADVQEERLVKEHHRRWYAEHGKLCARIRQARLAEMNKAGGQASAGVELRLFGVPASLYGSSALRGLKWLGAVLRLRPEGRRFYHELLLRQHVAFAREGFRHYSAERRHSHAAEVAAFARALLKNRGKVFVRQSPLASGHGR
jgi:glycosyltransferase involved in cell wall biosynthesis